MGADELCVVGMEGLMSVLAVIFKRIKIHHFK